MVINHVRLHVIFTFHRKVNFRYCDNMVQINTVWKIKHNKSH